MTTLIKGQEEETEGGARQWRYVGVKSNSSKLWYGKPEYSGREQFTQLVTRRGHQTLELAYLLEGFMLCCGCTVTQWSKCR